MKCAGCNREKGCLSLKAFRAKRQVDLFYGEEVFLRVATIKLPHVLKELE